VINDQAREIVTGVLLRIVPVADFDALGADADLRARTRSRKPVDLGFLDFRTRAPREQACRRELELNRRLAPDVYLGTMDLVGLDGAPCDHLLVMRRMPEARRLSRLVVQDVDVDNDLRQLARLLAVRTRPRPRPGDRR